MLKLRDIVYVKSNVLSNLTEQPKIYRIEKIITELSTDGETVYYKLDVGGTFPEEDLITPEELEPFVTRISNIRINYLRGTFNYINYQGESHIIHPELPNKYTLQHAKGTLYKLLVFNNPFYEGDYEKQQLVIESFKKDTKIFEFANAHKDWLLAQTEDCKYDDFISYLRDTRIYI